MVRKGHGNIEAEGETDERKVVNPFYLFLEPLTKCNLKEPQNARYQHRKHSERNAVALKREAKNHAWKFVELEVPALQKCLR